MSATLVNLRLARKAKARSERDTEAAINRRAFGRTKSERELAAADVKRLGRHLDAHQVEGVRSAKGERT